MKHSKDAVLKIQKDAMVIRLTEADTNFCSTIYVQSYKLLDFLLFHTCNLLKRTE